MADPEQALRAIERANGTHQLVIKGSVRGAR